MRKTFIVLVLSLLSSADMPIGTILGASLAEGSALPATARIKRADSVSPRRRGDQTRIVM